MSQKILVKWLTVVLVRALSATAAQAETFGTGANQFTLDFVPISGSTNPTPA